VLARGRMEDPATAEILPKLYDPEIHIRQLSTLAGTAGDFYGYDGLVASARETVRPLAELEPRPSAPPGSTRQPRPRQAPGLRPAAEQA
jgi:hypothetical protein